MKLTYINSKHILRSHKRQKPFRPFMLLLFQRLIIKSLKKGPSRLSRPKFSLLNWHKTRKANLNYKITTNGTAIFMPPKYLNRLISLIHSQLENSQSKATKSTKSSFKRHLFQLLWTISTITSSITSNGSNNQPKNIKKIIRLKTSQVIFQISSISMRLI